MRALCAGREAWYVCACACVRCAQGVDRGTCARVRAYVVRRAWSVVRARVRACVVRRAWSVVRVRVCVRALCAVRGAWYVRLCVCACVR